MPLIGSVVDFWKNSGTISTRPPTNSTSRISTIMRKWLVSIFSCDMPPLVLWFAMMDSFFLGVGCGSRNGDVDRTTGRCRLDHMPQHDQHAQQVQQTTHQTQ